MKVLPLSRRKPTNHAIISRKQSRKFNGGPNSLSVSCQGAGLKIWASGETHNTVTIATARLVYGIRNPADKQLALF